MACPAEVLQDANTTRWIRAHGLTVAAYSNSQLALALSVGIKPSRMVAYGDRAQWGPVRGAVNAGVRQFVVNSAEQVPVLQHYARRPQQVLVDVNTEHVHDAIAAICQSDRLHLVGLHCGLDAQSSGALRYATAVGAMVVKMAQIHERCGLILSRLSLTGQLSDSPDLMSRAIDEATEATCARWHFPRPSLAFTPQLR